ncbi:MAG: beta-aspartyl-peptidase [Clostridiales bacterium]|jgi:beta-aspartyl-dipeptidase (metallo-type)|nr:beta-aspartyl-peptidase [Eubacteriales bacterium]MDH7566124.1 beta-aspartyl-peptidase [Clostridiales bacterium]
MTHGNRAFKLLKGGHCLAPEDMGRKDLLLVLDKIYRVEENIPLDFIPDMEVIDCTGKLICPGFIDQHLHITGGGGEEGPASRIPELMLGDIISSGITTVVGVLGLDGITRSIPGLLAKARALTEEGITAYIYTGSYGLPAITLTGKVSTDIGLIDQIIGVGEIAIADSRSSHPTVQQLRELACEARTGALIGAKAGVVHIHVGDGKEGLVPLFSLTEESDFPMDMFVPTHLNRNKRLLNQAVEYAGKGGKIDLTAGETDDTGYSVPSALELLLKNGVPVENITVSSDGNGSVPSRNGNPPGVGKAKQLYEDIRGCILGRGMDAGTVLKTVTSNVARTLKIYPQKGVLSSGSDADILVLDKYDFSIHTLLAGGEVFIENGRTVKKGRFES